MTALPGRRRRRTVFGAVAAFVLLSVAVGLAVVGGFAVVNSTAGQVVAEDIRPVAQFPNTDDAALAVVDDNNQLTSLIIATLSPDGTGGSIVTVPVNADASVGFGDVRRPLNTEIDPANPAAFFEAVEATLAISLQFGEIVAADRLAALIEPVVPISVNLPEDVIDSSLPGTGRVAGIGERTLNPALTVRALRALDASGSSYDHHETDVEIWSALAANSPLNGAVTPPRDEFDRPVAATSIDEVFTRLWQGPVQVRDLALQPGTSSGSLDVVILDRVDSLLVFAQISPARVLTPSPGLVFRIELPYSDDQINAADDVFATRDDIARKMVGELLFESTNIVSVDTQSASSKAVVPTRVEVADDRFLPNMEQLVPGIFGESELVVATDLVAGVDVVVVLGTGYIDLKREQGVVVPPPTTSTTSTTTVATTSTTTSPSGDPGDTVSVDD